MYLPSASALLRIVHNPKSPQGLQSTARRWRHADRSPAEAEAEESRELRHTNHLYVSLTMQMQHALGDFTTGQFSVACVLFR